MPKVNINQNIHALPLLGALQVLRNAMVGDVVYRSLPISVIASVAELLRASDTLTMFEATVCGRS